MVPEHYADNILAEIMDEIESEIIRVVNLREKIRKNPKPDLEYLVMPERLKCYCDGLKHCYTLLSKYRDIEKVETDE
jgi:hypothetical protein